MASMVVGAGFEVLALLAPLIALQALLCGYALFGPQACRVFHPAMTGLPLAPWSSPAAPRSMVVFSARVLVMLSILGLALLVVPAMIIMFAPLD